MKEKLLVAATVLLFASCHSFHIEKRRYMKGFHIEFAGKKERPEHSKTTSAVKEETKQEYLQDETAIVNALQQIDKPGEVPVENTAPPVAKPVQPAVNPSKKPVSDHVISVKEEQPEQAIDLTSILISAIGGAGIFAFLIRKKKLKEASRWARDHQTASRILIALSHICLAVLGLTGGLAFMGAGVALPMGVSGAASLVFLLGTLLYPRRGIKQGLLKHSFVRQKTHDLVLGVSGLVLMLCLGNQSELASAVVDPATTTALLPSGDEDSGIIVLKVLLFIVMTIALLAALYGLLVWSCDLACAGYDGAAALVLLGGGTLVIFLYGLAARWIFMNCQERTEFRDLDTLARLKQHLVVFAISMIVVGLLFLLLIAGG